MSADIPQSASTNSVAKPERALGFAIVSALARAAAMAAIAYAVYSVWRSASGAMEHYVTHIGLALVLASLDTAACALASRSPRSAGRAAVALAVAATIAVSAVYFVAQAKALEFSQPFITGVDFAFGCLFLGAVLILVWLVWGAVLALFCATAAVYFAYGDLLPDWISTGRHYSPDLIVSYLAGMGGPRGALSFAPLSADVVFLLLVYGGALHGSRVVEAFGEIGAAIGNLFRGGVAYSAITASTLIGMVTGQTVSNVALSGSMTIPTMKRNGFSSEEAGAIEVLASNGSQLIPPIMGLGAFLMAEILGVSYVEIAIAAIIPAALYMIACVIGCASLISASGRIPHERQVVDWPLVLWMAPSFLASFSVLIGMLLMRYSASKAAFFGLAILIALSFLRPRRHRPSFKCWSSGLYEGALTAAKLALILTGVGVIVQMLGTTGAGLALGRLMIDISGGHQAVALITGMLVALFIGMGLPTPAAYALIAIVVVPSLVDLGLTPLAANFFGFYFAIFSSLTPPVAVGILTAVRISGGSFMGTARECVKLGGVCLLLPYLFVRHPDVLAFPNVSFETMIHLAGFVAATMMLSAAIYGGARGRPMPLSERLALVASGPGIFIAAQFSDSHYLVAPTIIAAVLWRIWRGAKRPKAGPPRCA